MLRRDFLKSLVLFAAAPALPAPAQKQLSGWTVTITRGPETLTSGEEPVISYTFAEPKFIGKSYTLDCSTMYIHAEPPVPEWHPGRYRLPHGANPYIRGPHYGIREYLRDNPHLKFEATDRALLDPEVRRKSDEGFYRRIIPPIPPLPS